MIREAAKSVKVDLKNKKLEDEISGSKDDEAYRFLSSIGQILDDVQPVTCNDVQLATFSNRLKVVDVDDEEPGCHPAADRTKTILAARDAREMGADDDTSMEDTAVLDDDAGMCLPNDTGADAAGADKDDDDDSDDEPDGNATSEDSADGSKKKRKGRRAP